MCMQKVTFSTHVYFCILWVGLLVCFPTVVMGVEEPDDMPVGVCYSTSAVIESVDESCWTKAFERESVDDYRNESLKVELDGCQIVAYDVNSIPQNSSTPIYFDLEVDDLFLEWDENDGDHLSQTFTFDGVCVVDPNCEYARVTVTNDVLKWTLYRVTEAGTLTITGTGTNEHDVIQLQRNYMDFGKTADVEGCVTPDVEFTYQICFTNDTEVSYDNCFIIDWLPKGVSYPDGEDSWVFDGNSISMVPGDLGYNEEGHFYVWDIGSISVNDSTCVTLDVTVNKYAAPGMYLHNVAELWADDGEKLIARAILDTSICCWGDPNIIYVDESATGFKNGTSWKDAYADLADALRRATETDCSESFKIYVAQGTYDPNETEYMSFVLPDNCSVYGGFPTGGCNFEDRNPKKYKTILTGLIDDDDFPDVTNVVTMGNETLLDGVTVMYGGFFGSCIHGSGADFAVQDCIVKESYYDGIYAINGNVTVKQCTINSNDKDGIRHEGEGYELTVERSWVLRNGEFGLNCQKSTPTAKNSIISESGLVKKSRAGVRLYRPTFQPVLRNCTIANNKAEGISFTDNADVDGDPNNLDYPEIRSCIVYYNNDNGSQLSASLNADRDASYCCIADCNEMPGVTTNFNRMPGFAYTIDPNGTPDPNNYHLSAAAFCINLGDPAFTDETETDYDGETRLMGIRVDIGADEVNPDCEESSHELDLGADGVINLVEFSRFSAAWLTYDPNHPLCDPNNPNYVGEPNEPGYISQSDKDNFDPWCDLVEDLHIDLSDLEVFVSDTPWLWTACWYDVDSTETMAATTSSMSAFSTMSVSTLSLSPASIESTEVEEITEVDSEATAQTLMEVIVFVDDIIAESPDNVGNIEEMRTVLMEQLKAIVSEE